MSTLITFSHSRRVHFVGIGGIGMSGIAEVLLTLGWPVSGSDLRDSAVTERLAGLGAKIFIGHAAENIAGAEVVVVSSAVAADNPETRAARERQIPVIPRAAMLAELMRLKFGIAVGGMHGKTTTTSMIATVLGAAGLDPTVVVGGRLDSIGSNARLGTSEYLVAEADESDRSFLQLSPIVAVITNIDREHLDCYSDLDDIRRAFVAFAERVPFYGAVLLCNDDENARAIAPAIQRRVLTYGVCERPDSDCDLAISGIELAPFAARFRLVAGARAEHMLAAMHARPFSGELGEFTLAVPGRHNVLNAAAAIGAGLLLGCDIERLREGLARFRGVDRRFQRKGEVDGVAVIDDYGHHPTEIAATLAAARQCRYRRVLMLFQPHRYTRTQKLHREFVAALAAVDRAFLLDIYAASEAPIPGVTTPGLVADLVAAGVKAEYVAGADAAVERVVAAAEPGDLILTQGAGNVSTLGDKILRALVARATARGVPAPHA
ncbi:MAG: UDP-N-acetylmuramate--L-alanine ligase [Terriglobales bacterium]